MTTTYEPSKNLNDLRYISPLEQDKWAPIIQENYQLVIDLIDAVKALSLRRPVSEADVQAAYRTLDRVFMSIVTPSIEVY